MSVSEKMTAIADAVRKKTGGTEVLTLDQMAAEIAGITSAAGENMLDYVGSVGSLFSGAVFGASAEIEVRFGAKYTGTSSPSLYGAFRDATAKSIKVCCDRAYTGGVSMAQAFRRDSADSYSLQSIDFSEWSDGVRPSDMTRFAYSQGKLTQILGELDMTYCTTVDANAFAGDYSLQTIRFKAGTVKISISFAGCTSLSDESIQSIIDGLADLTDSTAQTLTLHADVGAKLTDEQKADAAAKNWTLAY